MVFPFVFSASLVQICTLNSICLNDFILEILYMLLLYGKSYSICFNDRVTIVSLFLYLNIQYSTSVERIGYCYSGIINASMHAKT